MAMVYGVFYVQRRRKTKPIQSQFKLVPSASSGQALSAVEWSQFQEFAPLPGRIGTKKPDL